MFAPANETFEIARRDGVNKKWHNQQDILRFWEIILKHLQGANVHFDYTAFIDPTGNIERHIEKVDDLDENGKQQFDEKKQVLQKDKIIILGNPHVEDASTYFTTTISGIFEKHSGGYHPVQKSGPISDINLDDLRGKKFAAQFNNFFVEYNPDAQNFSAHGLIGRFDAPEAKEEMYTNAALREVMTAAVTLALSAKAAGWAKVDFGNTTDPVKKIALWRACESIGLDCTAAGIDYNVTNQLPNNTFYKDLLDPLSNFYKDIAEWPLHVAHIDQLEESAIKQTKTPSPALH